MTWTATLGYVAAALLLVAAAGVRADPRLASRLGAASRRRPIVRRNAGGRLRPTGRGELQRSVPDLLDLVALSVTAGLTPRLALERGAAVVTGPLAGELEAASSQVGLGVPWRDALRATAERTGLTELRRLAVALERSERLGAPVAQQLRRLAGDVREEERLRLEERARRAPVVMLFPLVFCILPAFVVAALIPAVLVAARGLG